MGVDSPQPLRDRLSTAWFAWQALQLLGPSAAIGAAFDFTDSGIDRCLQALQPSIREVRLKAIAVHTQSCSKCQDGLLAIGDGKYGAKRWICARTNLQRCQLASC
eukprot:4686076-Amphidinium_carterae.1